MTNQMTDQLTDQLLFASVGPAISSLTTIFSSIMAARNVRLQIQSNEALEEKRQILQREIADFQAEVQRDIAKANLAFQAMRLQKEQALQRELTELNSQRQLEIAKMQRETTLKMPEVHTLFANWPLRIVPSQILNAYPNKQPRPLRVLLSPPTVEFDKYTHPNPQVQQSSAGNFPKLEKQLAESLRDLLNNHYPQASTVRPVELLDGAWDSSRYSGGASLRALYSLLQSEPVVILDSEAVGDFLNFRVAYWGLAQETYAYQPILSRFPFREVLYASAKARALAWKEVRDKLLADGENLKEINEQYGGDNVANLAILEDDEKKQQKGIVIDRHYRVNQADWEVFCQVLSAYHTMTLGVIADGHFLLHYDTPPQFIQLLPTWLSSQTMVPLTDIVQWVVDRYDEMFQALMGERAYRVPGLRLELAESLAQAQFLELAQRQVKLAVQQYFAGRLASQETASLEELLTACLPVLMPQDVEFLTQLQAGLRALRLEEWVARIQLQHEESVRRLAAENAWIEAEKRAEEEQKTTSDRESSLGKTERELTTTGALIVGGVAGVVLGSVAVFGIMSLLGGKISKQQPKQIEEEKRKRQEEEQKRLAVEKAQIEEERKQQEETKKVTPFTFETVTADAYGKIIRKEQKQAQQIVEDLGNGVILEMVYIPGGTFLMGAPAGEKDSRDREKPQHRVTIQPFYLGKYPVTKEQWRVIMGKDPIMAIQSEAEWKATRLSMGKYDTPVKEDDNEPVRYVSWDEAVEFCQKLSQCTGNIYRLPSEAQWEYACRAGTTTPFYFGETLTIDLANYADGTWNPLPAGSFPPNTFGLYDMHGNFWEWCQDIWHDNYVDAPTDGSAWMSGSEQGTHLLRGGSWDYRADECRSAYRRRYYYNYDGCSNSSLYDVGFRLSSVSLGF